jgi:putative OPT family oligopeptide transporter
VLGVVFGALVIPPILDVLNTTFGFQGAPGAGENALAAPQASLISSIAQGVLGGNLDWSLIGLGAGIGAVAVVVDEILRARKQGSLPPLALGMGIYLPMGLTLLIPIGAIIGYFYGRWAKACARPELAERLGILAATGLIAGESLFGVVFAGVAAVSGSPTPLAVVAESHAALVAGHFVFAAAVVWVYWRTMKAVVRG